MKKNVIFIIVLALLFLCKKSDFCLYAAETEVPIVNQLRIFHKILSMEITLKKVNKSEITVGVVFQSNNKISNETKKDIFVFATMNELTIGNVNLKFIPIDLSVKKNTDISSILKENKCEILIITQIRSIDFKEITKYTQEKSVIL